MITTIREACDYYTNLLAFQYKQGTKNRPALAIVIKQLLGDLLAKQVEAGFDIDTAVGAQLDILGKYIGLPRNIGEPEPQPYFSFSDYDDTVRPNGFTDYENGSTNAQAIWYQYLFDGMRNTDLSDTAYRFMLKMKIVLNANDSTLASIQQLLRDFLPGIVALVDNADMTLTYTLGARVPVAGSVLKAYLPKPMGVGVTFVTVTGTATPSSHSKTVTTSSPFVTVTTNSPSVVTPHNTVGAVSYSWELVSGNPIIIPSNPSAASTTFAMLLAPNPTNATAVYRCIVTDSRGIVGYSNDVTIHLILQTPP